MQLRIEHTWPKLGINRSQGQLSIEQSPGQLEIKSIQATLSLEGEPIRVEIDQYPCRADVGMKNNFDLLKEAAERGRGNALEGIGRRAAEGDQMAAIQNKVDAIVSQAASVTLQPPTEFNFTMLPQSRPIINFVGEQTVAVQRGGVQLSSIPATLTIDYQPSVMEIYLQQQASLKMEFVGDNLDIQL